MNESMMESRADPEHFDRNPALDLDWNGDADLVRDVNPVLDLDRDQVLDRDMNPDLDRDMNPGGSRSFRQ